MDVATTVTVDATGGWPCELLAESNDKLRHQSTFRNTYGGGSSAEILSELPPITPLGLDLSYMCVKLSGNRSHPRASPTSLYVLGKDNKINRLSPTRKQEVLPGLCYGENHGTGR